MNVITDSDMAFESAESAQAYSERNSLVAFVSKLYPSHLCRHEESDLGWDDDWRNIVCIHSPGGQLTWHLHDTELPKFAHLQMAENHWDGHDTNEKYRRLAAIRGPVV